MAIVGVGIDVVDFQRFAQTIERTPNFINRVSTPYERELKLSSQAARFAAKESLAKALNAKEPFNWQEVEIANEVTGKPYMIFSGAMKDRMARYCVNLSLSHDGAIASAVVILESKESE
jgi:holo-[acyl-carrier protein] synthase